MKGFQEQHMDKNKGWGGNGREVGMAEVVRRGGGKGRKLYLNNNKIQKYLIKNKERKEKKRGSALVWSGGRRDITRSKSVNL